jgi:hypothetical protein
MSLELELDDDVELDLGDFMDYEEEEELETLAPTEGTCNHCGAAYADCRQPVAHGVPSIDTITLPAEVNAIAAKYTNGETTASLTSHEREIWDRANIMGYSHF